MSTVVDDVFSLHGQLSWYKGAEAVTDLFDHLVGDVNVGFVRVRHHQGVDVTPEPAPHVTCT